MREEQGMDDTAAEVTEPRRSPVGYLRPRTTELAGWCHVQSYLSAIKSPLIHLNSSDSTVHRCSEPTPFHPLNLLILVKDRANFINKVCSPINRLQTYYRILGSKSSESKDMARPIWLHSTVTISVFEFSFSYST